MRAGRNDPCPCGSGQKYKKCCMYKDMEAAAQPSTNLVPPQPAASNLPGEARTALPLPRHDPAAERWDRRWEEFEAQDYEGQIAVFLKTLDDQELMDHEMAFEMLTLLHDDAAQRNERLRFAELVDALRQRRPEVFDESASYFLSWCLEDAVVDGRQDMVPPLARELAARAGGNLDLVSRSLTVLAYHGQLSVLIEMMRIGWPGVQSSSDVLPWGLEEFANRGADYEIFDYLEQTASPDPTDAALLERIKFFLEDPSQEYLSDIFDAWTGKSAHAWTVDDFTLKPPRKRGRDGKDQGTRNLARLLTQFVVYLRRDEGVSFPKGALVRDELYRYFLQRHEGKLNPRLSMLEEAMHPHKKPPRAPKPAHPLCPERVTFDAYLAGLLDFMNSLFHMAAALFEVVPAWLRFLESRGLIDAERHVQTVADLRPLHGQMLRLWESFHQDPSLYRAAQRWPEDAAKTVAGPLIKGS